MDGSSGPYGTERGGDYAEIAAGLWHFQLYGQ